MKAVLALKDDYNIFAKFSDDLAARAAGRTWHLIAIGYSDSADDELAVRFLHCGEDGGALSTDGEAVRSIFNVASGEDLALVGEDSRANVKVGIRCISAMKSLFRGIEKLVAFGRGNWC